MRSSSLEAEALASANLGLAGQQAGDLEGARACLHRHMQLAEALRGGTSAEAYAKLAQLERDAGQIEVRGRARARARARGRGGPDRGGPYPLNPNP